MWIGVPAEQGLSWPVPMSYLGQQMGIFLGLEMDRGEQPKGSWKVPLGFGGVRAKVSSSLLLGLREVRRETGRDRQRPEGHWPLGSVWVCLLHLPQRGR